MMGSTIFKADCSNNPSTQPPVPAGGFFVASILLESQAVVNLSLMARRPHTKNKKGNPSLAPELPFA
jgi:hypothetical protein